jgi:hypothetical protein
MQDATRKTRSTPYIDARGDLIIPFDAPPKYHYWTPNGQSIFDTLAELNAPEEVLRRFKREDEQKAKEGR